MKPTYPPRSASFPPWRLLFGVASLLVLPWTLHGSEAARRDPFEVRLGAFMVTNIETTLDLETKGGRTNRLVDFVDTLGGESSATVFRADASWRFADAHSINASWFDIDLRASRRLTLDVEFGDEVFPVGTDVVSRFRTNVYKLDYSYSFWRTPEHEVSGMIGGHVVLLDSSITARSLSLEEDFATTAPLPVLGLAWQARWTPRLSTRLAVQLFQLSLDEGKYDGQLSDFLLAAEYKLREQVGVGLGFNRFDLKVEMFEGPFRLELRHAYNGVLLYGFMRF